MIIIAAAVWRCSFQCVCIPKCNDYSVGAPTLLRIKNVFLCIIEGAASALRRCNNYILGYTDAVTSVVEPEPEP